MMLWVTRSHIRVNRAATGWLVRRFGDPESRFRSVAPAGVSRVGAGRRSFDSLRQRALRLGAFDTISLVGQAGGPASLRERFGR